jgi:hypothetical protein
MTIMKITRIECQSKHDFETVQLGVFATTGSRLAYCPGGLTAESGIKIKVAKK